MFGGCKKHWCEFLKNENSYLHFSKLPVSSITLWLPLFVWSGGWHASPAAIAVHVPWNSTSVIHVSGWMCDSLTEMQNWDSSFEC